MPQKFTSIVPQEPQRDSLARNAAPRAPITSDPINESVFDENTDVQIRDSIDFKIKDVVNNKTIRFRCTVSNLTESSSPMWNQIDYIGRPYPIYLYKGVTRTVTFDFKVYSTNKRELPIVWDKINYLSGLTHPAGYSSGGYMIPPYVEFTLGDLYKGTFGFISSYNKTIASETSWEVRDDEIKVPHMADINLTINIIEDELKSPFSKLYGFNPKYVLDRDKVEPRGTTQLPTTNLTPPDRL